MSLDVVARDVVGLERGGAKESSGGAWPVYPVYDGVGGPEGRRLWDESFPELVRQYYAAFVECARAGLYCGRSCERSVANAEGLLLAGVVGGQSVGLGRGGQFRGEIGVVVEDNGDGVVQGVGQVGGEQKIGDGDARNGGPAKHEHVVGGQSSSGFLVPERSEEGLVCGGKVGANLERNRKNRAAQKARKQARKVSGIDWRKRDSVKTGVVKAPREVAGGASDEAAVRRGFFSGCSMEVQRDLRESRARMLIAENERRAREEKKKVELMDSPEALMKEVIRVSSMALRLKKQTENQAIGGWAATVADSLVKSVAESAPSSVPSLEEVGYGKSSLKSSDGFDPEADLKRQLRREEYRSELSDLKEWYASQDAYDVREEERRFRALDERYADVLLTAEELEKKKIFDSQKLAAQAVCTNLAGQGMNLERLRDAMIDLKFMTEDDYDY